MVPSNSKLTNYLMKEEELEEVAQGWWDWMERGTKCRVFGLGSSCLTWRGHMAGTTGLAQQGWLHASPGPRLKAEATGYACVHSRLGS